jgi:menaquinone-9 beta-reductase
MKPITIIGGGLAGLTLGIALRREGVPVTLHEAGQYPRHRVCGEFLSGRGVEILRESGVYERAREAGAREASTLKFFSGDTATPTMTMSEPALCISRYRLDEILAELFTNQGGDLRTGSRYTGEFGEGVIRATGRQMQTEVAGWRWIGIKAHALNLFLEADLEMHLRADAYVGLCRVEGERVNVCGLFRTKETVPELKNAWENWLTGGGESTLTKKFKNIIFDKDSLSVVAGLPIKPFQNSDTSVFSVGDAVTMIPPVTGNGMSLAIESGWAAAGIARDYAGGRVSWGIAQELVRQGYTRSYGRRLRWAERLQRAVFSPLARGLVVHSGPAWPALFRFGFGITRR